MRGRLNTLTDRHLLLQSAAAVNLSAGLSQQLEHETEIYWTLVCHIVSRCPRVSLTNCHNPGIRGSIHHQSYKNINSSLVYQYQYQLHMYYVYDKGLHFNLINFNFNFNLILILEFFGFSR